jgi:hypothetical protein
MPIKLPNLDDRTYADLVAEAHTLIPVHAPQWTNHNESDPGITLVELFAYLTEMQIYRLNRVTDANVCAFLRLIDGVERIPSKRNRGMVSKPSATTEVALRDEVRDVVLQLRQQDRAVSCEDFERLARAADQKVTRAYCIPKRNLTEDDPTKVANAHVSVVIVPTEVSFDTVFWFDSDGYSDVTKDSDVGRKTIPLWYVTGGQIQRLYLGSSTVFESFNLNLSEAGEGYDLTFEYFDGKDWTALTTAKPHGLVDGTKNLTASGLVTFTRPSNWSPGYVKDVNAYWLRISSSTTPKTKAKASRIFRDLKERVSHYLEPRRLLTTRVHVVGPRLVTIGVHVNIYLKPDAVEETVKNEVVKRLTQFFNVEVWPFGRNVYVSEIYRELDPIPGLDFVTKIDNKQIITVHDATGDRLIKQGDDLVAIKLNENELVNFSESKSDFAFPSVARGREV